MARDPVIDGATLLTDRLLRRVSCPATRVVPGDAVPMVTRDTFFSLEVSHSSIRYVLYSNALRNLMLRRVHTVDGSHTWRL